MSLRKKQIGAEFSRNKKYYQTIAGRWLGNWDDAADAVSEAFMLAVEHHEQFDASRPLRPWLVGILRNVLCRTHAEKKRMRKAMPQVFKISLDAEDAKALANEPELQAPPILVVPCHVFIDALPTSQKNKDVLHLRDSGLKQIEIACCLQLEESEVSRIMKKMRNLVISEFDSLKLRYDGLQVNIA